LALACRAYANRITQYPKASPLAKPLVGEASRREEKRREEKRREEAFGYVPQLLDL
jgi:hypothetical protein